MKKAAVVFLLIIVLCFSGCEKKDVATKKETGNFKAVFVTLAEFKNTLKETGGVEKAAEKIISFIKDIGGNAVFLQVRANADSIYKSRYFPLCDFLNPYEESDALEVFKKTCDVYGIELHAWVNPYRISGKEDADISFFAGYSDDIRKGTFGTYFDPASDKVRKLIINGIKEITEYGVDGIHFDDYFYPTDDESFDSDAYGEYCVKSDKPLSLKEYRTANVNLLISEVKNTVKRKNRKILFTVSPSADIVKNREKLYADVEFWCRQNYIDMVIPQIYFGFDYPDEKFGFEKLILNWIDLVKDTNVKISPGLAPYKLNTDLKNDREEWENGYDIVAREIRYTKNISGIHGTVLFSYSYLNSEREDIKKQTENIEAEWKEKNE